MSLYNLWLYGCMLAHALLNEMIYRNCQLNFCIKKGEIQLAILFDRLLKCRALNLVERFKEFIIKSEFVNVKMRK